MKHVQEVDFGSARNPKLGISFADLDDRFPHPEQTLDAIGQAAVGILKREAAPLAKRRRLGGFAMDAGVAMAFKVEVYGAMLSFTMFFGNVESPQEASEVEKEIDRIQARIASAALSILTRDVLPRRRLMLELNA